LTVLPFAKAETLLPMLILTQRIKEAFDQACANLGGGVYIRG
jgi:hypothetical protein